MGKQALSWILILVALFSAAVGTAAFEYGVASSWRKSALEWHKESDLWRRAYLSGRQ